MNDLELVRKSMAEIRRALVEEKKKGDRKPGEFTSSMYVEETGVSPATARRELEKAVELGIASKRKSTTSGNTNLYRWIDEKEG